MIQVYASAGVAAAFNELVEPALSAAAGLILVQESEFVFIEYPEELVPFYWLEFVFGLTKVDPQDAILTPGSYNGGMAVPFFCPFADFVVIGGRLSFGHLSPFLAVAR
jgi:hypothetical protein